VLKVRSGSEVSDVSREKMKALPFQNDSASAHVFAWSA
jgi:hypothetical protein